MHKLMRGVTSEKRFRIVTRYERMILFFSVARDNNSEDPAVQSSLQVPKPTLSASQVALKPFGMRTEIRTHKNGGTPVHHSL